MTASSHHSQDCPLCRSRAEIFFTDGRGNRRYFHCRSCDFRFLDPNARLSAHDEAERYRSHNNDIEDLRYLEFLTPLKEMVERTAPRGATILDFGCGAGPVLKRPLEEGGFRVHLYDPFFYPDREVLDEEYDFIIASEVLEHLYNPYEEIIRLKRCLKRGGR